MEWTKAVLGRLLGSSSNNDSSAPAAEPASPAGAIGVDLLELTVRELNEATASFSDARLIGEGQHAVVYRASLPTGCAAAAKMLVGGSRGWRRACSESDPALVRRRLSAASRLRHRNVVRLLGYTATADFCALLYEFADMGTLHDALHGDGGELSWAQRVRIALDAARGLAYLHGAAVTHGGVRSSKVLLFPGFRAKIAGHDVFRHQPDDDRHAHDTPASISAYLPPECIYLGPKMTTPKSDVFSFGVVLLELLTGNKPFDQTLPRGSGNCCSTLWIWATPLMAEGRTEECMDPKLGDQYPRAGALELGRIAVQCLQERPRSRPSMDAVARLINSDIVVGDKHGVI